jgi:hypothetical protein
MWNEYLAEHPVKGCLLWQVRTLGQKSTHQITQGQVSHQIGGLPEQEQQLIFTGF